MLRCPVQCPASLAPPPPQPVHIQPVTQFPAHTACLVLVSRVVPRIRSARTKGEPRGPQLCQPPRPLYHTSTTHPPLTAAAAAQPPLRDGQTPTFLSSCKKHSVRCPNFSSRTFPTIVKLQLRFSESSKLSPRNLLPTPCRSAERRGKQTIGPRGLEAGAANQLTNTPRKIHREHNREDPLS
ncbi:hypothetical protein K456DRAFT_520194 [Colletotrichum gloeosporioides 23]|nr:hypothetical protein K456DRAFT_520194 [Colletotrichum gloeosporioides 23]